MGEKSVLACMLGCIIAPPFILQSVGLFSPNWVSNSNCDSIGLVYSCCYGDKNDMCKNTHGGDELDVRVLGLEATAFAVMFLAVFGTSVETCCNHDADTGWCGIIGGCCFTLYPVAGLFSFIGCMLIAGGYSTSELGWSFCLCLTAGCLILVETICFCYCMCKAMKHDLVVPSDSTSDKVVPNEGGRGNAPNSRSTSCSSLSSTPGRVVPYEGGGRGIAPYEGGGGGIAPYNRNTQIAVAQVEQRAVVHDPESGGFLVVMRKFTFAHLIHNFSDN